MSNPNNCKTCGHKERPEGGHCYMFRDAPTDVCMAHTGRQLRLGELSLWCAGRDTGKSKFAEAVFNELNRA